jgi:hypothetical protein
MEQNELQQVEDELIFFRKKVFLLEEIIKRSNDQKIKMAKLISELLSKDIEHH